MTTIARLLTYCPDTETAQRIATTLLDARLIACANIGAPVESLYLWDGARQSEPEIQLWLKTRVTLSEQAMAAIEAAHPYEVPLVAADQVAVNADYAAWVNSVTSEPT